MDVHIGEMRSTVRALDSESLLTPEVLDRITRVVIARVHEDRERQRRAEADREIRTTRFDRPYLDDPGSVS